MPVRVRIYEYLTKSKCEEQELGLNAGSHRVVYEGTVNNTNYFLNNIEEVTKRKLTGYDMIEFVNDRKMVTRYYYKNSTFYPMNMYSYNPNENE